MHLNTLIIMVFCRLLLPEIPPSSLQYPGAYTSNFSSVMAISGTDENDEARPFSQGNIDIVAPAIDILSTTPDYNTTIGYSLDYDYKSGTSMAAPLVSATAALMLSVNPNLTPDQIKYTLEETADKVPDMNGEDFTVKYGFGRLNAYEAVKEALPDQYDNNTFTSSTSLNSAHIAGSSSLSSGVTLTVPSGEVVVIEGSISGSGDAEIQSYGKLIIDENTTLDDVTLTMENGSELIIRPDVTLDTGTQLLTLDGEATIGDNFTMLDGFISIGSSGSVIFDGDADLQFIESAGMPPLYQPGYFDIYGDISFSDSHTVNLSLSPNASSPYWEGITVYNSASGITLQRLDIEDSQIGINLSSTNNITLEEITIQSPSFAGFSTSSSDFFADEVTISNSSNYGVQITGGTSDLEYADISGSADNGLRILQNATLGGNANEITGSGGNSEGVLIDNSSYDHDVGTVGPNGGYDVKAVNYAWGRFIETTWGSGSPDTYADGTSTLIVHDPQKIVAKAAASAKEKNENDPKQLLLDWADQRWSNPTQAISWLKSRMTSYSDELEAVATVLLFDAYLASGSFNEAQTLANTTSDNLKQHLAPGVFAQRLLQLALNSGENEELARQSLKTLKSSGMEDQQVAYLERIVNRRYGTGQEQVASKQTDEQPIDISKVELSNYPNPFNPSTLITYRVIEEGQVMLEVFDMLGKRVATLVNEEKPAGQHEIRFDAGHLSSRIYFYRIRANGFVKTNKLTLIK